MFRLRLRERFMALTPGQLFNQFSMLRVESDEVRLLRQLKVFKFKGWSHSATNQRI